MTEDVPHDATTDRFRVLAPSPRWPVPRVPVPSFSVILPVRNAANVVGEAIESALAQSTRPHEVIVVDDGSTDDLIRALGPFRNAIRLIRGPGRGVAAARNVATAEADGDFVVMLDADDRFLPSRLEALGDLASRRPDLDVLATDAFLEKDGRRLGRFGERVPFAVDDQRTAVLDRCFVAWPAIRRSRLATLDGFDESLRTGSDWDCVIRLVLSGCAAGQIDEPLYVYRLHEGSLTADRLAALRDRVTLLERSALHPGLHAHERAALERSLRSKHRKLLQAEAELALLNGRSDARLRALRLAGVPGADSRLRLVALGWALAPGRAARLMRAARASGDARALASTAPWQV